MKKLIIVIGFLALTNYIYSQSFVQENKTWNVVECINLGGCWTQTFKLQGDTAIGQYDYKKLHNTYDTTLNIWWPYGAMREVDNQIFFYLFENETEVLLYDFNLNPGDTFITFHNSIEYQNCPIEIEVYSIDSVYLENGELKQRFNFSDGEVWISGIGSMNGLVYVGVDQCIFDMYYGLSCCHENDELIYQSSGFDNCFINTVGLNENSTIKKYSVHPNPFSQSTVLKFDYENSQTYSLQIVNTNGQLVYKFDDINSGEVTIQGKQFNQGIYFYRLTGNNYEIARGKLIKVE